MTYLHHQEYEAHPLSLEEIKNFVSSKKVLYDHCLDQTVQNKFHSGVQLKKAQYAELPSYIQNNIVKFKDWLS